MSQLFEIVEIDTYGNETTLPGLYDSPSAREARAELETENPDNQYVVRIYPMH